MTATIAVKKAGVCPVCHSAEIRPAFSEPIKQYWVMQCNGCSYAFVDPRPTQAELDALYSAGYHQGTDTLGYKGGYRSLGEHNMRQMWADLKQHFPVTQKAVPRRLLDIGCATGAFLHEASSDGWQCWGVEPVAETAQIAVEEFGIDVAVGDILTVKLPSQPFGLVTMWHIVEHFMDPVAAVHRAADLVAPGGYLFIEVPSWGSLGRRLRGAKWAPLKPPEHINFFTPASLSRLVEQSGLTVVRVQTTYPSVTNRAKGCGPSQNLYRLLSIPIAIFCALGLGGNLRVLARKPD